MKKSKHTPTPWALIDTYSEWAIVPVGRGGGPRGGRHTEDICRIGGDSPNARAHASLFLASPALLAACRLVIEASRDTTGNGWKKFGKALDAAEKAVAAVEGEDKR